MSKLIILLQKFRRIRYSTKSDFFLNWMNRRPVLWVESGMGSCTGTGKPSDPLPDKTAVTVSRRVFLCSFVQAFMAQRSLVDLARLLRAHSSADGRITSLEMELYSPIW